MENADKKIDREKLLAQVTQELKEIDDIQEIENLIVDNSVEFLFDSRTYRVRKPNRSERLDIKAMKNKKQNELFKDPANVTETELVDILLQRQNPIDIPQMRKNIHGIQQKIENLAIRLTESPIPNDRQTLLEEIKALRFEQVTIQLEMSERLSSCIEKQLLDFLREYIVYVVLEKKVDEKWIKFFKSYEQFMGTNSEFEDKLIYRATHYLAVLMQNDE